MAIPGDKYLIGLPDIERFYPIAEIDGDRLNPYILLAQSHDLKPVLGEALYYDFMKNFNGASPTYDHYRDLMIGKEYIFQGYTVAFEGIIETVVWYTLMRFTPFNGVHTTRFGNVKKLQNDKSEPIVPEETNMLVASFRSNGIRAAADVTKYLLQNISSYPLYPQGPQRNLNRVGAKWFDA